MLIASMLALTLTAASAGPVQGKDVRANIADYVDRTITVSDQFGGLSSHFSSAHKDKGMRPGSHYHLRLWQVGVPAFLPKTKKNAAVVDALKSGDLVTVTGVVEAYRIDGRGFTEISIVIPDRDVVFFRIKEIKVGASVAEPVFPDPLKVKPDDYVKVELDNIALEPAEYLANDVVIEQKVGHGLHIMKSFSPWELRQGLNKDSAIKLGLHVGFPVFIERNKENLAHVKAWRRGARLRLYGNIRVEQRASGDYPMMVVHRAEVVGKGDKHGTEL